MNTPFSLRDIAFFLIKTLFNLLALLNKTIGCRLNILFLDISVYNRNIILIIAIANDNNNNNNNNNKKS